MTQTQIEREKVKRKRERQLEEMALVAYMAGRSGNGMAMYAASEMVG
jgi:hypothetical protein